MEGAGHRIAPEGLNKMSAPPPAEFNSAPGAEQTRGQKILLYLEKEEDTFNNRSLSIYEQTPTNCPIFCECYEFSD